MGSNICETCWKCLSGHTQALLQRILLTKYASFYVKIGYPIFTQIRWVMEKYGSTRIVQKFCHSCHNHPYRHARIRHYTSVKSHDPLLQTDIKTLTEWTNLIILLRYKPALHTTCRSAFGVSACEWLKRYIFVGKHRTMHWKWGLGHENLNMF